MKYIRTKDGIYEFRKLVDFETYLCTKRYDENSVTLYQIEQKNIIKQSDDIEELCDYFDYHDKILKHFLVENNPYITNLIKTKDIKFANKDKIKTGIYGAIWTDKGLIYVAKMNEKGEFELL